MLTDSPVLMRSMATRTIPFNPVGVDGRVITQDDALKLIRDRIEFSMRLDKIQREAESVFHARGLALQDHIASEHAAWIKLCESYRWRYFEERRSPSIYRRSRSCTS
ncbi:hypothetical protein C8Q77DRAFT_58578 [Trametes polyzona]|nr:hypothetical protein C8Q77DRAFT_58578 [Trametes polyzona]